MSRIARALEGRLSLGRSARFEAQLAQRRVARALPRHLRDARASAGGACVGPYQPGQCVVTSAVGVSDVFFCAFWAQAAVGGRTQAFGGVAQGGE